MKTLLRMAFGSSLALMFALVLLSCGKGSPIRDSGAFQAASPELRGLWQTAFAAAKTNGYLVAYTTLENLRRQPGLSADQSNQVENLLGAVGTRMFKAANDGDAQAAQALRETQGAARRR